MQQHGKPRIDIKAIFILNHHSPFTIRIILIQRRKWRTINGAAVFQHMATADSGRTSYVRTTKVRLQYTERRLHDNNM